MKHLILFGEKSTAAAEVAGESPVSLFSCNLKSEARRKINLSVVHSNINVSLLKPCLFFLRHSASGFRSQDNILYTNNISVTIDYGLIMGNKDRIERTRETCTVSR